MKRLAVVLLTVCTLLAQGLAWASMAPAIDFPMSQTADSQDEMPCHGDKAPAQMQSPCCGESCDCPELCAGHAAVVAPVFSFIAPKPAVFESPQSHDLRLGIYHSSPLRPPIASQS